MSLPLDDVLGLPRREVLKGSMALCAPSYGIHSLLSPRKTQAPTEWEKLILRREQWKSRESDLSHRARDLGMVSWNGPHRPLFTAPDPALVAGASVTFEPGARTAWHTHPLGQTLIVTAGCGWAQHEGPSHRGDSPEM